MLTGISFAGIDKKTNVSDLIELQRQYPIAEFGVLASKNWKSKNRYDCEVAVKRFKDAGLNLSLHLCGEYARRVLKQGWVQVRDVYGDDLNIFNRVQLNIVGSEYKSPIFDIPMLTEVNEVILQQVSPFNMPVGEKYLEMVNRSGFSILFDTSGGKGIYTKDFDVMSVANDIKIGFAGGINPDNCVEVVKHIEANLDSSVQYWIDMESGVRDERDWFSVSKCREVCDKVMSYIG